MATSIYVAILCCVPAAEQQPAKFDPFHALVTHQLHRSANAGQLPYVRAILERHPKLVNAPLALFPTSYSRKPSGTEAFTPLHRAAQVQRRDVVAYLIEIGVNVNAVGDNGWTALHLAAQSGNLDVVKQLVKVGAKVGAKTDAIEAHTTAEDTGAALTGSYKPNTSPAIPPLTPLDLAVHAKRAAVVEYLKSLK